MPPKSSLIIQPEESIRSFVSRALFIKSDCDSVDKIRYCRSYVRFFKFDLLEIAFYLGWHGSYGFDRLICLHTPLANNYVVKNSQDISYSRRYFPFLNVPYYEKSVSYCPQCAKEDYLTLGFSYWRRAYSLSEDEIVCHKHNTLLLTHCPFCHVSLSDRKHGLEVMWRGCGNRYLWEVEPTLNCDSTELYRARFKYAFCSSMHHISDAAALRAVHRKVKASVPEDINPWHDLYWLDRDLETTAKRIHDQNFDNNAAHLESSLELIVSTIFSHYQNFDEFMEDLGDEGFLRPVQQSWGIYVAMGDESVWYVTPDFKRGISVLSCPYPCDDSMRLYSQSGFRDVDELYHYQCCIQSNTPVRYLIKRSHLVLPDVPKLDASVIDKMKKNDSLSLVHPDQESTITI